MNPKPTQPQAQSQAPLSDDNRRRHYRRHEDLKLLQRERELEAARRICQTLSLHINMDTLVEGALRTALGVIGAEAGSVLLADPKAHELVFRYVIGPGADTLPGMRMPWDKGIAGSVFHSGEAAVIADVTQDGRHFSDVDACTGYKTRDMIVLPLKRWEGGPIGVMEVLNKREGRLTQDDVAILTIISAISAETIEQSRLYEEVKLAEVGRLVGDIAHDVNNMLQPVVTVATLLREELGDRLQNAPPAVTGPSLSSSELYDESGAILDNSVRRIKDRLQEIGDCVKGMSSLPKFAQCRLANVINDVMKTLSAFAGKKNINICTEGLDALPSIIADERRLYNAFYNLINNAIPEVPAGGTVRIGGRALPERPGVLLWVTDTGRGMSREVLNSLFTPGVISSKDGGTGLGTKIVKDVVDAHRGGIHVESEEGRGTTFYIELPINPASATAH